MSGPTPAGEDSVTIDRESPEEAFALLANDTRAAILTAMMETPDAAVSFTELYDRVEAAEDSGQFNYHLNRLTGRFVRKADGGYELTHAGKEVVGAIYAGTYTANATLDPLTLGEYCITCGGTLRIEYAEETFRLTCADCDRRSDDYPFPPRGLDQFAREELPAVFGRWMDHYIRGLVAGFCPVCTGRVDGRLVRDDDGDERHAGFPAYAEFECRRCGVAHATPGTAPVHTHPSVRDVFVTHGFDVHAPVWEILAATGRPTTALRSAEPPTLEVTLTLRGETVVAVVDEHATVESVDRRPVSG